MKRPGIKDVVERAGVSAMTVSHLLHGYAGARIAAATAEQVRQTAAETGTTSRGPPAV